LRRTRRPGATLQSFAALCACALSLLWLSGKVFSPQYMTWALPIAIALPWARERGLLIAILALSQVYLRIYFDDVLAQTQTGILLLVVRQALVLIFAYGCWRRWLSSNAAGHCGFSTAIPDSSSARPNTLRAVIGSA
jgi:hypothetical protein